MKQLGTIELATERLTLRRFELEDAENLFYNCLSSPEVTKYLSWPTNEKVEETEAVIEDWMRQYERPEFYLWAIELNELEQPIGSIGAVGVDEQIDAVELVFCIGKEFWNRGYTTEALTAVIRFLMNDVGCCRVWARHDTNHSYAGKAMEAAGMEYEGTLRKSGKNNQGICDMAVYAKVKSDSIMEEESEDAAEEAKAVAVRVVDENGVVRNVISDETMEYVGILAKLELSPEEAEAAKKDMADMLDYIDQLNELDTAGIEPMSHVFPVNNVFREDIVTNGDGSEATLANAPLKKDGGFKVPKTIG